MGDNKRADLLVRVMTKLREQYPNETSEWIRNRAEVLVQQKMDSAEASPIPPKKIAALTSAAMAAVDETSLRTGRSRRVSWFKLAIVVMMGVFAWEADEIRREVQGAGEWSVNANVDFPSSQRAYVTGGSIDANVEFPFTKM